MPTVNTNGVDTAYQRRGDGDGPPLVCIHGAVGDQSHWADVVDDLAEQYTVVTYDIRGHGRTGGSARGAYSMELFADDLVALLDALDIERAVLCGHSIGGCIAQVFAARQRDRVAALVLVDTFSPEILSAGERVQRSTLLRVLVPLVRLVGYDRVERAMVWGQERFSKGVSGNYERILDHRADGPRMATEELAKVMGALARFEETPVDFAAITAPTLVVYGEHEARFIKDHVRVFVTELDDVRVEMIPDAGHAPNIDHPDALAAAIRAFLTDRPADVTSDGRSSRPTVTRPPATRRSAAVASSCRRPGRPSGATPP
jgi:pimeloyl-ACP methyl ester carboxylesterase